MTDLRTLERDSIRAFVQSAADDGYLSGRVLDYGCGKQPYRDIVEAAGGEYVPFDAPSFPANVGTPDTTAEGWSRQFDTILCTQVIQYVPDISPFLFELRQRFPRAEYLGAEKPPGHLVMTYPTNWPEVEPEDLHRFTKAGMERLLTETGFEIVKHEPRASVRVWVNEWLTDEFVLGYGVIGRV